MENLIDLVNELDVILSRFNAQLVKDLPHIVVVGGQSAGKSSVLESFVGRDFLPRGKDIVTRRPLILKLKTNRVDDKTYAMFANDDKVYEDSCFGFDEIRNKIQDFNLSAARERYGVSDDPVHLEIVSPSYLDLTLVDLPGMVRVSGRGQSDDISEVIKKMILSYIEKENCLILAVTPANNDLANSDAIELSRQVDPKGKRTIGVLTKLDLMDKGTDARLILDGKHAIELKRGFIGVVNRSQKDIDDGAEMSSALDNEIKFFEEHYAYKDIAHRQGITYLKEYLHKELSAHIKKELPKFRDRIQKELTDVKEKLDKMRTMDDITKNVGSLVSHTIVQLKELYRSEVGDDGAKVVFDGFTIGVSINQIMNEVYCRKLDKIEYDQDEIIGLMITAIKNINGTKKQMFSSNKAFFEVIRRLIEKFRRPTLICVEDVTEHLKKVIKKCTKELGYPKLTDIYKDILLSALRAKNTKCRDVANEQIDLHQGYFNASQEDFKEYQESPVEEEELTTEEPLTGDLWTTKYQAQTLQRRESQKKIKDKVKIKIEGEEEDDNESEEIKDEQMIKTKDQIIEYVESIKRDMKKMTPKICHLHLVDAIGKFIDTELNDKVSQITYQSDVESLTKGCPWVKERQELFSKEKYLQEALDTIEKHLD